LVRLAGKGSELHRRHKVYLDVVTVVTVPERYKSRLLDLVPGRFRNLRLKAFERHDLVLAKLERNIDRDREDLRRLTSGPGLDVNVLRERYATELRPWLGRPDREDLKLQLWADVIQEVQAH
jgi:G:T-mismatch repair DNA endonuclease (very short patch repair protein)